MKIFEFSDYKAFIRARIKAMPTGGHGEYLKMARALRIHTTRVSHIFRGELHLTLEQACSLCTYLGLNELETEYFLALVQIERAGSEELRRTLRKTLERLKQRSQELVHRVPKDLVLSENDRSRFYSDWIYSAIRLATAIPELRDIDALARYFDLPRERVREILDFLLSTGLCIETDGELKMGPRLTHVEARSMLVNRHHANWRLKAMQRHERLSTRELAYTCPVVISKKDQGTIREMLMNVIEDFTRRVKASTPDERLSCLTLDWFEV